MAIFPDGPLIAKWPLYYLGYKKARISTICAKARIGGEKGYAFKIKELGYAETQGDLIEGAEPLWNRFSNNSPGEFTFGGSEQYELGFRLKRDSGGKKYCFNIGGFRGYNPDATPSGVKDVVIRVAPNVLTKAVVRVCPSEYDWRKLDPSIKKIGLISDKKTIISDVVDYAPTNNYTPFMINIQTATPYTASLRLAPMNQFNDWSFLLPNEGKLEVLIKGRTVARMAINTPNGGGTSQPEELTTLAFDRLSLQILRRPNNAPGPSILKSVRYTISDENGEIVFNKTRTNTYPTKESVNFDWVDVGIGSYITVTIFMEPDVMAALQPYDYHLFVEAIYE